MYDRRYGTAWTTLSRDEAIERAFALGVDAHFGVTHPEEYERIVDSMQGAYARSIVELAYKEGKEKANQAEQALDGHQNIWDALVDQGAGAAVVDTDAPTDDGDEESEDADEFDITSAVDLPAALAALDLSNRPGEDDLDALDLPEFLRR